MEDIVNKSEENQKQKYLSFVCYTKCCTKVTYFHIMVIKRTSSRISLGCLLAV